VTIARCRGFGDTWAMRYFSRVEKSIYSKDYRAAIAWLREQRKASGLTMRALSARLNVHHSWVARIEQGDRRLDLAEFVWLCKAIGCNPYECLALLVKEPLSKTFLQAADKGPTWSKAKAR
jgi:transcriptional regulator with XRE-family HTH domain